MDKITVFIDKKISQNGTAHYKNRIMDVMIGKNGAIEAADKREGDNKTPLGTYPIKRIFARMERLDHIDTDWLITPITPDLGWCDDPQHKSYNTLVRLPFDSSHEEMCRDDHLYDIVIEIGHNSDPVVPELGSAIFLHLKRDKAVPTAGCVAFDLDDLLWLVSELDEKAQVSIQIGSA